MNKLLFLLMVFCVAGIAVRATSISPSMPVVCRGSFLTLTGSPAGGTWASTVTSVATITAGGVVTGVNWGTTTISYTAGGSTATVALTVEDILTPITGSTTICVGGTTSLGETFNETANHWSSSATGIATVGTTTGTTNTITGHAVGTAIISVAANACNAPLVTVTVHVITLPSVASITGPTSVCEGGTISLGDATAGGSWSSSSGNATVTTGGLVTGVTAGSATITYTVTNMCGSAYATYPITVLSTPVISGPSMIGIGVGGVFSATGGGGGYTWSITPGSNFSLSSTTGTPIGIKATGAPGDVTTLAVTSADGCSAFQVETACSGCRFANPAEVTTVEEKNDISVYPNPNSGQFTVELPATWSNASIILAGIDGKVIYSKTIAVNKIDLDLSGYAAGIYVLSASSDGKIYHTEILKK